MNSTEYYEQWATEMISKSGVTGGVTDQRVSRLANIMSKLSPTQQAYLRLEECCDEHTGYRYGNAKKRKGKCEKIGGGGRNRGNKYAYQVWAVWTRRCTLGKD